MRKSQGDKGLDEGDINNLVYVSIKILVVEVFSTVLTVGGDEMDGVATCLMATIGALVAGLGTFLLIREGLSAPALSGVGIVGGWWFVAVGGVLQESGQLRLHPHTMHRSEPLFKAAERVR